MRDAATSAALAGISYAEAKRKAKVPDSKKALKSNVRRGFGRIKPKWYIEVSN